jgi:16S rRNA U1498 N3-methylase RsmE
VAERVNLDRMRANVVEAAEQCNLVHIPSWNRENWKRILADWKRAVTGLLRRNQGALNPLKASRPCGRPLRSWWDPKRFTDEEKNC